ncbi:MAG: class I SAM-dependent methyltransferase [Chloroflexi bacterium]|nr:class I SAM-dependent methyltransferase [Chloroflexota bacterium]
MIRKRLRRYFFNIWYYRQPPWDTRVTPPEVINFADQHPPGRALDLGCGTGTNVIYLAKRGWESIGIDFAPKAIRAARRKIKHHDYNTRFWVDDVTRLHKVSGSFDFILDMGCYHSLDSDEQKSYLKNVDRLLNPGGHYLLYVFFRPSTKSARPGVVEADLSSISTYLTLILRQNGFEKDTRPSAWLHFQKQQT